MAERQKSNVVAWLALLVSFCGLALAVALAADARFDFFKTKAPRLEAAPPIPREVKKVPIGLPQPPLVPVVPIESLPKVPEHSEPSVRFRRQRCVTSAKHRLVTVIRHPFAPFGDGELGIAPPSCCTDMATTEGFLGQEL